ESSIYITFNTIYNNIFVNYEQIEALGNIMYSSYSLYLILCSFILLLAMIGPIIITLDKKSNSHPFPCILLNFIIFYLILLFVVMELSELFKSTLLSQTHEISLSIFVPIMINSNVDTEKLQILLDNKAK